MRDGLHAPAESIPQQDLERIRSFLDRQSRIDLAVWVMHEQQGAEGPLYDHHLMLGVDDDRSNDLGALELGIEIPQPGWLDVFPLSEVELLRSLGAVVWERGHAPRAGDPLDFRITWEPLEPEASVVEALRKLVRVVDGLVRIDGAVERLWKNGAEVRRANQLYLEFERRRPHDFEQIGSAARGAGLDVHGMSAGLPADPRIRTSTLYEAAR
jgi:hypothetical protein